MISYELTCWLVNYIHYNVFSFKNTQRSFNFRCVGIGGKNFICKPLKVLEFKFKNDGLWWGEFMGEI